MKGEFFTNGTLFGGLGQARNLLTNRITELFGREAAGRLERGLACLAEMPTSWTIMPDEADKFPAVTIGHNFRYVYT